MLALAPGCDRAAVDRAVRFLVKDLADPGSQRWYASVCLDVRAGRLPLSAVVAAHGRAKGRGVKKPGAAFTAAVKAWGG